MGTFENNSSTAQPEEQKPQSSAPNGAAYPYYTQQQKPVEQKPSPFADSPYVMYHQQAHADGAGYAWQPQPAEPPKNKKPAGKLWRSVLAAAAVLALVAGSCGVTAGIMNARWETLYAEMAQDLTEKISDLENQIHAMEGDSGSTVIYPGVSSHEGMTPGQVYAQNVTSVVAISCSSSTYGSGSASGSGFILTEDGYVVTNYHVVEGAAAVSIVTHDGETYPADIAGYDASNDIALLKVNAQGLSPVTLGSSDDLIIGDMVVAIGNPLGELTATQTVGYISGKDREVTTDGTVINMLQTDAAINPGNSGGPMFNMQGEVVGITTAKYSGTTSSGASIEGLGFAIPIDDVLGIIGDLKEYGYVTGAYMGVVVQNVDSSTANMYGLPMGAYVVEVTGGGSADRAGIRAKDIIIALDDYEVKSITGLTLALRNYKAGDTAVVTVVRGGAEVELTITFDEKPNTNQTTQPDEDAIMPEEGDYDEWYDYFFPFFGEGND